MESQEIKRRIIKGMKENGFKLTRQRLEIIDILAREKSHPSASAILGEVRKKEASISLSTVYYTLDLMKRAGLIRELEFDDRDSRYEGDISDHLNPRISGRRSTTIRIPLSRDCSWRLKKSPVWPACPQKPGPRRPRSEESRHSLFGTETRVEDQRGTRVPSFFPPGPDSEKRTRLSIPVAFGGSTLL